MSAQFISSEHPYYPPGLSLPGYAPAVIPFTHILAVFFSGSAVVFLAIYVFTGRIKHLSTSDRVALCWFVVTGIIHFFIEGAVVRNAEFYRDNSGNVFSEIWKEYAKADSRYASRDSFVISMEAVTSFVEGPACFLIAYGIATQAPWRYTLELMVSLGQLYGDVLYFATTWLEGWIHSRPEPLYFWFYFVFINSIWVVIPLWCLLRAATALNKSVRLADLMHRRQKAKFR